MKTYINGNCIEQILTNAVELTQAEYDALPTEQKNHGTYIITDSDSPSIPATDVEYDNNTTVKDAIDNKVDKSGDTMTGNLLIKPNNALGAVILGKGSNASEYGVVQMWDDSSHYLNLLPSTHMQGDRTIYLPDKTGTLALTNDITFNRLAAGSWSWNTQASYSIDAYSSNCVIVYGARDGRGFLAICPQNNNEVYVISNNIGCTITHTYDGNTGKHTITFNDRTTYVGSNIFVYVIG